MAWQCQSSSGVPMSPMIFAPTPWASPNASASNPNLVPWSTPWADGWPSDLANLAPVLPETLLHEPMMVVPTDSLDPLGNGMQSVQILGESPLLMGPPGFGDGTPQCVVPSMPSVPSVSGAVPSFGHLQTAMAAAHTATNACGSGCVPLAARQVANGLWCVLVSDPSMAGAGGFVDAAASAAALQVESVSVSGNGVEHGHFAAPTMNLSLAEHLEPIPEADSPRAPTTPRTPRTPPPKSTSNDVLPTPSPVSYRRVLTQPDEDEPLPPWTAPDMEKPTAMWPMQSQGDLSSAAVLQDHAVLSLQHHVSWSPTPQLEQSQTMMANDRMTPWAVQACVLEAVAKNPSLGEALMSADRGQGYGSYNGHSGHGQVETWKSKTWTEKKWRGQNKTPRWDRWSDSYGRSWGQPQRGIALESYKASRKTHRVRGKRSRNRDFFDDGEFYRDEAFEDKAAKDEWPRDETEGGLLGKTVWYLIEKVLLQRPHLEAGKRVTVSFPHWIHHLPVSSTYSWANRGRGGHHKEGQDEKRSLVNRALRTMTKKLPGCCWTVDMRKEEMQVHLADVARFSRFCDGM